MPDSAPRPVVGIPASQIFLPEHSLPQHGCGERYILAVTDGAGAVPMIIPALGERLDYADLAERLDGLMLTGGRANVEPHHYDGPPFPDDEIRDPPRDGTVLPLIRECVARGVPVFGVCRGIQEINVALGGTLHYRVHLVAGKMDHRMPREGDMEHKFGPRHMITVARDGHFHRVSGVKTTMVNSLHGQAVDRLADGFIVEAAAEDGVIEGIWHTTSKAFCVGVQWHAEWRFEDHPLSAALWREFGDAARERARQRAGRALAAE